MSFSEDQIKDLVELAAERGAERALAKVGLADDDAGNDIRDLRNLIDAYRSAKKTVWQTVIKSGTMLFLGALMVGVAAKLGFDLGHKP